MEIHTGMMADPMLERGQSEPPPQTVAGRADLLPLPNINNAHVLADPEDPPTTYFNEHHCGNILKVLKQQQEKAEYCDMLLVAGDQRIPVHSCIMAANSPYLKLLVDQYNTLERQWGQAIPIQVTLPTTSLEVVHNMLCYMYTGDISINSSFVQELLSLTGKLMMDDVKQCCELHMIKALDLDNWMLYKSLAKMHSLSDLQNEVNKFLAQNLMILKTAPDLEFLPSFDLATVLNLSNVAEESGDIEVCKLECVLKWVSFDVLGKVEYYPELVACLKPALLSTEAVERVLSDINMEDVRKHVQTQSLKDQIHAIEEKRLAEELERQKHEEAERKKEEEEAREREKRKAEERQKQEAEINERQKNEQEELERQRSQAKELQPQNTQAENLVEKNSETTNSESQVIKEEVEDTLKGTHESNIGQDVKEETQDNCINESLADTGCGSSDTDVDDSVQEVGEKQDAKEKGMSSNDSADGNADETSLPVVIDDGDSKYLEDGTPVIEPQSTWPVRGRGKRKSYKPKKIYKGTGRPRGRPRKNISPGEQQAASSASVKGGKKRGRPRMNRDPSATVPAALTDTNAGDGTAEATTSKRIRTKTFGTQEAVMREIGENSLDEAPEGEDGEDRDPSWMPQPDETPIAETLPHVKVKKKRGRKPNPGDKTYYCTKCPRTFNSMGGLSHHMKGHGSDTPMLCEICGFSTRHYGSMNVHRRKHAGKVMHCPFEGCDHTEVHRARLDDHISAVHHGVKRHMCSICGKSFGAKKHLQRHEGLHGKAKDIACNLCQYLTNRTDKLREHIKRHHPVVAVEMGMLKQEDLDKTPIPKPRTKKKSSTTGPKKKKGTRYDMHAYSELETPQQDLKLEDQQQMMMVSLNTSQPMMTSPRDQMQLQQAGPQVVVQMPHSTNMQPHMQGTMSAPGAPVNMMSVSSIPSHLLGTTTLSEEVIQYLATYTADQIHMHANQAPPPVTMDQPPQPPHNHTVHQPHPQPGPHTPWPGSY